MSSSFSDGTRTASKEIRKQIPLYYRTSEYIAIRKEAAKQKISMCQLIKSWHHPELDELMKRELSDG